MSVGIAVTKATLDEQIGYIARTINLILSQAASMEDDYLSGLVGSDLEALGYTATEAARILSAFDDLKTLYEVYTGQDTVDPAIDFRRFAKFLYGTGQ